MTFREDLLPAPEPKSQRKWFRFTGKRVKKLTKLSSIPIPTVVDWILHYGHENKGNDHQLKMLLIVKQTLLISILGNVQRTLRRICILMLECKGFTDSTCGFLRWEIARKTTRKTWIIERTNKSNLYSIRKTIEKNSHWLEVVTLPINPLPIIQQF